MDLAIVPFAMSSPGDPSGVSAALRTLPPGRVVQLAVLAKIEGTATLNDVSREFASERIGRALEAVGG
ncbi:MAG: ring-opening amidohydrolase, partial [Vicinamibacterales bacterium]